MPRVQRTHERQLPWLEFATRLRRIETAVTDLRRRKVGRTTRRADRRQWSPAWWGSIQAHVRFQIHEAWQPFVQQCSKTRTTLERSNVRGVASPAAASSDREHSLPSRRPQAHLYTQSVAPNVTCPENHATSDPPDAFRVPPFSPPIPPRLNASHSQLAVVTLESRPMDSVQRHAGLADGDGDGDGVEVGVGVGVCEARGDGDGDVVQGL